MSSVHKGNFLDYFDFSHLGSKNQDDMKAFINTYEQVFCKDDGILSSAVNVKYRIITENVPPIVKKPYRVPVHLRKKL